MSLRTALRSGVAAACIVATIAPAGWAAAPAAVPAPPRSPLEVKIGQGPDFSRIEFHWLGGARVASSRSGQVVTLRFNRDSTANLAELKVSPPKWLKSVASRHVGGGLEVALTLADDADARIGAADGATFVNLFAKTADAKDAVAIKTEVAEATPPPNRPNPAPPGGVVRVEAAKVGKTGAQLTFRWAAPAGAAIFRRGDALWVVFDTPARLDAGAVPKDGSLYSNIETLRGADYSALRMMAPAGVAVSARAEGASWVLAFGPAGQVAAPGLIEVSRDMESATAGLSAVVAGATRSVWVNDPAVGDRLAVVTALGPLKGLPLRREYVDIAMLGTIQGLALESYADDLTVEASGDLVHIGRPRGMALSPASVTNARLDAELGSPQPAAMPGLIDPDWSKTASGGFLRRYNTLMDAAAEESGEGEGDTVTAHMALARFLIGQGLAYEAIGVLNGAAKARESLMGDGEFRALRGIARVMAGRYKEADSDFSTAILADDPSSALWRGLISAEAGQWADARQRFAQGSSALDLNMPIWRSRFARADALAALELGDFAGAGASITDALNQDVPPEEQLQTRLIQARLMKATGDTGRALNVFEALSRAAMEEVAAPARLHATEIRLDRGEIKPNEAADTYDSLRYRWRGDGTEIDTIRALGDLYLRQGRYREALEALRSAGQRLPDLPQAVALQNDLASAFRALFLEGQADGLQPIQALALFYDFKELTPIGAEGDQMVRNLVRRLVDVDLLPQAADLLKYQVDNRLDGAAKSQVATDLALIYLMDRKPESALEAINGSRTTLLTTVLNAERRIVTARALIGLGRLDAAEEIVETDSTKEAQEVKAEIAWKSRAWPAAGGLFEKGLGDRWKSPALLTPDDEAKLMRAAIAYSLADDDVSLERLRSRYSGYIDAARNPEALRVALSGVAAAGDFTRITTDNEAFSGWVTRMKQRFRQQPKGGAVQASLAPPAGAPAKG
jgi:tetratricopeptide (TPR) repeat protein